MLYQLDAVLALTDDLIEPGKDLGPFLYPLDTQVALIDNSIAPDKE